MALHIFVIILITTLSLIQSSTTGNIEKEFQDNCLSLSKHCAESRIKRKIEDLSLVFKDAIYYYCLDLYKCTEGKQIVCNHVRRSETAYGEKSQRQRVLQQCKAWKIQVEYDDNPAKLNVHSREKAKRVQKNVTRHKRGY